MSDLRERIAASIQSSAFNRPQNLIHVFAGGSALHGASMPGKADLDICGIFMEEKRYVYGLSNYAHFVSSTSGDHARNTADDVDITLYSLRKWAGLAAKGNPTALSYLFALNYFPALCGRFWERVGHRFQGVLPSKRACNAYRGFVTDQMKRLLGEKGLGKHGQRPELTVSHGYDTKAAMHSVRLVGEGIELMTTGGITFPRPNVEYLRSIRRGEYSLDKVCAVVSSLLTELDEAEHESKLPDKPDFEAIDTILVEAYEKFYREN
jgi:uncharacterized protein